MFPQGYFPGHYFAPRYFPKVGLSRPGIIRVILNGTECTDRVFYGTPASWNIVRGARGTCSIPFVVEPGELFEPQVGESIEVWDPADKRVWMGTIDATSIRWIGDDGWHVFTITGVSVEALFEVALDKVKYTGVSCASAFADLITLSGVTAIGSGTIDTGPIVESLEVSNVAQGFDALALLAGFIWYVDPEDGLIYFHAPRDRAAAWDVESTDILWETIEWQQSRADLRTSQTLQLSGVSMSPVTAVFAGDGIVTAFNIPTVPEYVISIVISTGSTGRTIVWGPGTAVVTITPAPPNGSTITVRYSDQGLVNVNTPSPGVGDKSVTYTKTRSFTPNGGLQEATAILARHDMLPAQLTFSTDKPGLQVGRVLTIALDYPLEAGRLNGDWLVKELDAMIVPGLDQREEPFGHFRYTVRLINTAATAIYQGDGSTTTFELPVVPSEVTGFRTNAGGRVGTWTPATTFFEIVPALDRGKSAAVDYVDPVNAPDVPNFISTWEDMTQPSTDPPSVLGDPSTSASGDPVVFTRTLTLFDLTVRDDAAPHTPVYADGTAYRMLGVLRKTIASDLTIRLNKGPQGSVIEVVTVTIPSSALIDEVFEFSLATGSPAVLGPFLDKEVLTADILASDGSTDDDGVAQFTVEWTKA